MKGRRMKPLLLTVFAVLAILPRLRVAIFIPSVDLKASSGKLEASCTAKSFR